MLQFVPLENSLDDNAPGYHTASSSGPACWKCKGTGVVRGDVLCKVCSGSKRLPVKRRLVRGAGKPGQFVKRTEPIGWDATGPAAFHHSTPDEQLPQPLQPENGEQLCFLVGNWRIFQRVGGHRWTTDDLVTAWVAGNHARTHIPAEECTKVKKVLDLGCGNASVLMMVAWQYPEASCLGLEARAEAVSLARRSIHYNCGQDQTRVLVHNADFRSIYAHSATAILEEVGNGSENGTVLTSCTVQDGGDPILAVRESEFDLVTGTPPYFRVDFELRGDSESGTDSSVVGAYIRQGGMPTCKESAPARCEFRGGIEAYCQAAARVLAHDGTFVVCENWANHERALRAAPAAGLDVLSVQRVIGRAGKPPLFAVYTMKLRLGTQHALEAGGQHESTTELHYAPDIIVRDKDGAWTVQYAEVLKDMSYPVASLHPNGTY
jgi:tRNA1Val (adenine37-N6)-methyltransferase